MAVVVVLMLFDKGGWKCPRCKLQFDYRKRTIPTKYCINCELPIYYGSTHFFDYWGTEQGNKLIEKVRKQNENKI
jgi:hypothetical protein